MNAKVKPENFAASRQIGPRARQSLGSLCETLSELANDLPTATLIERQLNELLVHALLDDRDKWSRRLTARAAVISTTGEPCDQTGKPCDQ